MKNCGIPANIILAVNALIEPFGVDVDKLLKSKGDANQFEGKKFMNVAETERYTGLSRWTVERAAQAGLIEKIKLSPASRSGKVLYGKKSIDTWLESYRCVPAVGGADTPNDHQPAK